MRASQKAVDLIKKWEGIMDGDPTTVNLDPYYCPAGYWTIGWGRVVRDANGQMLKGRSTAAIARAIYPRGITMEEAETFLRDDMRSFEFEVNRALRGAAASRQTTQGQFDAMVSLCFNIGGGNFVRSSVLRLHLANQRLSDVTENVAVEQMVRQGRAASNAADAFLLWNKMTDPSTGQRVTANGLVNRRRDERRLYLS
ncbi:lysozyme [Microcystis phage Mwe-JY26]